MHSTGAGMVGCSLPSLGLIIPMPHKHNAARRHHIPKMSFKVQNWPAYEAGLRRRGSLTLWIEDAALEGWQTIGPSGQAGSVRARAKDAGTSNFVDTFKRAAVGICGARASSHPNESTGIPELTVI